MKRILLSLLAASGLLAVTSASADEIVRLICRFEHGEIEVSVNYSKETANGAVAMISDKEIIWTPKGGNKGLAVINRYTGVMQISKGRSEFIGMCNKAKAK
ncbi:MAG: hypothetical protein ABFS22_00115 [Pseudomonadota bacterium]